MWQRRGKESTFSTSATELCRARRNGASVYFAMPRKPRFIRPPMNV